MKSIPAHIAIIMDGNGRWAKAKGLSRIEGHRHGMEMVDGIVTACKNMGVKFLTLYAFSDENWDRPAEEIKALMEMLIEYLKVKKAKMIRDGVRFETIGNICRLPDSVQEEIDSVKEATKDLKEMTLVLALSYGSRQEICRAVNKAIEDGVKEMTPDKISSYLGTAKMPDPDLLIRTSGEIRISNFLLWQIAYTELYFTDVMWPNFTSDELTKAIGEYSGRERRFGKTSEQLC